MTIMRAQTKATDLSSLQKISLLLYQRFFSPIGLLLLLTMGPFHSRLRGYLKLLIYKSRYQKTFSSKAKEEVPIVWVHAASGEFEYAKPLLKELKQKRYSTLVTFTSENYADRILRHPLVDAAEPLPLDLKAPLRQLICSHNPFELWIARTDLWPTLIDLCRVHQIPVRVFSARWPQKSPGIFSRLMALITWARANQISWVSQEDQGRFETFLNSKMIHTKPETSADGDTRFDQTFERLENSTSKIEQLAALLGLTNPTPAPILVAGSTWPADDDRLLAALTESLRREQLRLILVPHEPTEHNLSKLCQKLREQGLSFDLFSDYLAQETQTDTQSSNSTWQSQVLLVDRIGWLAELYHFGQLAFVGGGFHHKVHSVMEPLAHGLSVVTGPRIKNSPEAVEFSSRSFFLQDSTNPVCVANTSEELRVLVKQLLGDFSEEKSLRLREVVLQKRGASKNVIDAFLNRRR